MTKVLFYENENGRMPVKEELETLSEPDQAKAAAHLSLLQEHGHETGRIDMEAKVKKEEKDNTFKGYLDTKLKNKSFREAYEHYRDVLDIGLQIRDLREAAGLTQKKLAESMGVSQQVIARLENGVANNPTVTTLERIAKAMGHRLRFKFEPTRSKAPPGRGGARRARVSPNGKAGRP
ncbi:MAG: helix-turn-helix domain-containing protein [Fibrobacterota bacterium]|nr:helix-turn-helix domain-containing protein [Fibrobacterota bacterium]